MTEARSHDLRMAAIYAIPIALILVIPLVALFLYARSVTDNRLSDNATAAKRNAELIARVDDLRYELCLDGEARDTVIVSQLQGAIERVYATVPPGELRNQQIELLMDGINTLEPLDEPDCVPPAGTGP